MSVNRSYFGFGFKPDESRHHILVCIPEKKDGSVIIYERFSWQDDERKQTINEYGEDQAKARISKHKWELLKDTLQTEFNSRLKKQKMSAGRFVIGQTSVERMLGKELLVLVWAVEDCDPANVPVAIRNWLGLAPEERWWLYTMTNAATGHIDDRMGWRKALRYALCENPIDERRQLSLFDVMLKRGEEE
ncbi:MAG: DUF3780 domain-containing protein [Candidatus Eremiobacterota bacterium]